MAQIIYRMTTIPIPALQRQSVTLKITNLDTDVKMRLLFSQTIVLRPVQLQYM